MSLLRRVDPSGVITPLQRVGSIHLSSLASSSVSMVTMTMSSASLASTKEHRSIYRRLDDLTTRRRTDTKEGAEGTKGEDLIYGTQPVLCALRAKRRTCLELYLARDHQSGPATSSFNQQKQLSYRKELLEAAKAVSVPVRYVEKSELRSLIGSDKPHQGSILRATPLSFASTLKSLLRVDTTQSRKQQRPEVQLVLSGITDPMNMGALIRTAYYLGIEGIIVDDENGGSCPLTAVVSKASAGSMEYVDVHRVRKLLTFLEQSQLNGWSVLSTVVSSPQQQRSIIQTKRPPISSYELQLEKPTIVCIGSEGFGLKSKVLDVCDKFVNIPPSIKTGDSPIDSLNVSVATGIILHQIVHSRSPR